MSALSRAPHAGADALPGARAQTPSAPRVGQDNAAAEGHLAAAAQAVAIGPLEPAFVRMISERLRACCSQKRPLLTPMKRKDYEALRDQVRTLMDAELGTQEKVEVLDFRDDETEGGSLIAWALRNNNPAAAAAIVLGILDSGMPLLEKARWLSEDKLDSRVRAKLGKVRRADDPQQWAASLRELIKEGRDPVRHAASLVMHAVQPANASAELIAACAAAQLRCMDNRSGERMLCTATRPIDVLERMYGSYVSTSKHHVYAIPASRLEARLASDRQPVRSRETPDRGSSCGPLGEE